MARKDTTLSNGWQFNGYQQTTGKRVDPGAFVHHAKG
jgi:hypothetical protein